MREGNSHKSVLNDKDRKILACAELNAQASINELSEASGFSASSVRYTLQRFRENGLLSKRAFYDLCALGFQHFEIFFSLKKGDSKRRNKFIHELCTHQSISWVGEFGGDFDCGVNFCAKDISEVWVFVNNLWTDFGDIIEDRTFNTRLSLQYFGNKFLFPEKSSSRTFPSSWKRSYKYGWKNKREPGRIDDIDRKILRGLASAGFRSHRNLAAELELPHSSFEFRLKRLEKMGVFQGQYYYLKPDELRMQGFLYLITVKNWGSSFDEKLHAYAARHPNVPVILRTLGSWDYEITLEVPDTKDISEFTSDLEREFSDKFARVRILPSFGYAKILEYPFKD